MRHKKRGFGRKIIAAAAAAVMTVSGSVFAVTIDDIDQSAEPQAVRLVYELGIMKTEKGKSNPTAPVTRGEFADAVIRLLGLDADSYAGGRKDGIYDVTEYMDYSAAIFTAYDLGIVSGNGDGTFLPDEYITMNEAATILVKALGYDMAAERDGGYPYGYLTQAAHLKLFAGGMKGDDILSRDACACLMYNALNTNVMRVIIYNSGNVSKTEGSETVLWEYHDVERVRALVRSQVYEDENEKGYIILDSGEKLMYDGNDDLAGEFAEIYCRENKTAGLRDIVFLGEDKTVDTLDIDAEDAKYSNHVYTYGESDRTARISAQTRIFYNGCEMDSGYDPSVLLPKQGTIRLSKQQGGAWSVLKITGYTDCTADVISTREKMIYDKYEYANSFSYDGLNCIMLDDSGRVITADGIQQGSIVSYALSLDRTKARVIVSAREVSGELRKVGKADGFTEYMIGDTAYRASAQFADRFSAEVQVGDSLTLTLNFMGRIAAYEKDGRKSLKMGYMVKAAKSDSQFSDVLVLKLLTESDGLQLIETAETLTLDGESGMSALGCLGALSEGQLICYRQRSDGKIAEIDTAYTETVPKGANESENSLYKMFDGSADYNKNSNTFDGKFMKASDARVFFIPQNPETAPDKEFSTEQSFSDKQSYRVKAYRTSADSFYADALVLFEQGSSASLASNSDLFMINSVHKGVNEDGDEILMVSGFRGGKEQDIEIYEKCRIITATETRLMTEDEKNALEGGDIIRMATDSRKRMHVLEMIWDRSAENPYCKNQNPTSDTYSATYRFLYGAVHSADSSYFRIAIGSDASAVRESELQAFLKSKVLDYYIYGENRDGTWFKKGTGADIIPWKNNPSNPSKVLIRQYYSQPEQVIIFN